MAGCRTHYRTSLPTSGRMACSEQRRELGAVRSILVRIFGEFVQARVDRLDGAGHDEGTQPLGEQRATLADQFGLGASSRTDILFW